MRSQFKLERAFDREATLMDESLKKRRRAGATIGILGVLMLLTVLAADAGSSPIPLGDSIRIFLLVVGLPLVLVGILVYRGPKRLNS
jgi:hypothetical protein